MSKKWIAVTSGKGGVGKSVVARLLGEMVRRTGTAAWIMDGDGTVGQTLQYLGTRGDDGRLAQPQDPAIGVGTFTLHSPGDEKAMRTALETITEDLAQAPDIVLLDLPAASLDIISLYQEQNGLSGALGAAGWDPVLVIPVTPFKASRRAIASALALGPGFKIVAVRSEWFGDDKDYSIWLQSELRKKFISAGGIEVVLPRLRPWILAQLDEHDLTFAAGVDKVSVLDRQTLVNWIAASEDAIVSAAGDVLGLAPSESTNTKAKKVPA